MNNALESLTGIKQAFASHLVRETSMTFEQALESLNYDTDLQNIEKALKELAEIKKRAEDERYIYKMALDFISTHQTTGEKTISLKSANEQKLEIIDYILKGEKV